MIDNFNQEWRESMQSNGVLTVYKHLKQQFEYEHYLDIVTNKSLRSCVTRMRVSGHKLRIETGRYGPQRVIREERHCIICTNTMRDIEDEFHFILKCDCYRDIRKRYISNYYTRSPSMWKLLKLLSSKNELVLKNLCTFITKATEIRNLIINATN